MTTSCDGDTVCTICTGASMRPGLAPAVVRSPGTFAAPATPSLLEPATR
ncbi:MAG: hypothetical protein ACXV4A_11545 [Actinomycetes bacterium]